MSFIKVDNLCLNVHSAMLYLEMSKLLCGGKRCDGEFLQYDILKHERIKK